MNNTAVYDLYNKTKEEEKEMELPVPTIPVGYAIPEENDIKRKAAAFDAIKLIINAIDEIMDIPPTKFKLEDKIKMNGGDKVPVYAFDVQGLTDAIAKKGIQMVYAPIPVEKDATSFYKYLISAKGYKMIDPNSNPTDFDKPISTPKWGPWQYNKDGYRVKKLQVEYAHMSIPAFSDREYVVLNGFEEKLCNTTINTFYSCSVTAATEEKKGSSVYDIPTPDKPQNSPEGYVRMAYFAAFRVVADENDKNRCVLHYFQWMDLCQNLEFASAFGNEHSYGGFIKRLNASKPYDV